MNLQTSVTITHKLYASRLEKLGIEKLEDFLYHIPFRYEDFSVIAKIESLQEGELVTVIGTVANISNAYTKGHRKMQKATVTDETGSIEVMWFNQPFLTKVIHKGNPIALAGRVEKSGNKTTMLSPEYEIIFNNNPTIHTGRIVPVYPETKGVSSKWLRRQVYKILSEHKYILEDYLPSNIVSKHSFMTLIGSFEHIHFPIKLVHSFKAKERLAFDELFLLQLKTLSKKNEWKKNLIGNIFTLTKHQKGINELIQQLPFTLTKAQQKAIDDIFSDLQTTIPMNRLLQGDVGSGKTIVAAVAMYLAHLNGFQSVLMAPTEILAQQHYETIKKLLEPLGVNVAIATGSKKSKNLKPSPQPSPIRRGKKSKGYLKLDIGNLKFEILIGTHAVLNDAIQFQNLGLIAIDEQQRFGVEQRAILRNKGKNPHLLTMTATPIPRTVALTMYGNLDLSYLDEMPIGRKEIKTWLVPNQKRNNAYAWIRQQIKEHNSQIFIICPFIEESETMTTVKAAQKEYETLTKEIFPDLKVGLLHGKLKGKEKDAVLDKFRKKAFDILVATPVVEVGIDIPNATVIMIEAAERFGLSQLHQLRGRVGRGDKQSYCLLFTESTNPQTIDRLKSLEKIHNGAALAELDLKLRGSGDMYGTLQSGFRMLKIATFSDTDLLMKAKKEAELIFPELHKYPKLVKKLKEVGDKQVAPD